MTAGALPPDSWVEFAPKGGKRRTASYVNDQGQRETHTSIAGTRTFDVDPTGRFSGALGAGTYVTNWVRVGHAVAVGETTIVAGESAPLEIVIPAK